MTHPQLASSLVQRLLSTTSGPSRRSSRVLPDEAPDPELARAFRAAVGAAIARHAQPRRLRAGVLHVWVDNPVWLQELSFLKAEIAAKVAHVLQKPIRDVKLRLGRGPLSTPAAPSRTPPPALALSPEDRARAEDATEALAPDPELREAALLAYARWLASRRS